MEAEKWFNDQEVAWLKEKHPHLYKELENPYSGTQIIFDARRILDEEYRPEK